MQPLNRFKLLSITDKKALAPNPAGGLKYDLTSKLMLCIYYSTDKVVYEKRLRFHHMISKVATKVCQRPQIKVHFVM